MDEGGPHLRPEEGARLEHPRCGLTSRYTMKRKTQKTKSPQEKTLDEREEKK